MPLGFGPIGASAIGASAALIAIIGAAPGAALASSGTLTPGAASGNSVPGALPINPAMFYDQPGIGWNFPDMIAGDVDTLSFNFSDELPPGVTILSASAGMVVHVGVDLTPNAMILAGPIPAGSVVSVQVAPTVAGVSYWPRVTATFSDGQRVTLPRPGEGSLHVAA